MWTKGNTGADWGPDAKAQMTYASIPVLEHNGVKIAQSHAIQRYIASACGLMGHSQLEAALIDATEEQIRDFGDSWSPLGRLPEAEKGPAQKKFLGELGHKLAALEKQLRRNNKGAGYLVGDSISLADIYFFRVSEQLAAVDSHLVDEHMPPLLNALTARVASHPRIAAHIKAREPRPF
jgi:glutathione S-transferase